MRCAITTARLNEVVTYDPNTGVFRWRKKITSKVVVGAVAGCTRKDGYVVLRIDRVTYYAHRLAWFYMTGEWPPEDVDHKIGKSNEWANLRKCSRTVNMQNVRAARKSNPTGLLGAIRHRNRFIAVIRVGGQKLRLGSFDSAQAAHEAYVAAKRRYHEGCTL